MVVVSGAWGSRDCGRSCHTCRTAKVTAARYLGIRLLWRVLRDVRDALWDSLTLAVSLGGTEGGSATPAPTTTDAAVDGDIDMAPMVPVPVDMPLIETPVVDIPVTDPPVMEAPLTETPVVEPRRPVVMVRVPMVESSSRGGSEAS